MKVNPDKFQFMILGPSHDNKCFLKQTLLKLETQLKWNYLA